MRGSVLLDRGETEGPEEDHRDGKGRTQRAAPATVPSKARHTLIVLCETSVRMRITLDAIHEALEEYNFRSSVATSFLQLYPEEFR